MLYTHTVKPETVDLLRRLMQLPELAAFALVGGTNLSLRYGHRISVDLDLFTHEPFVLEDVSQSLSKAFPQAIRLGQRRQSIWLVIEGVKVDIVLHEYPYLRGVEVIEGIRLVAVEDIIPMKLEAMATRGVKKDFWDIAELLEHYSLAQMLGWYQEKYQNNDIGHVVMSMTYFEDAELQKENPQDLKGISWKQVKAKMKKAVATYVRNQL
ncbi:nucleotidyl transferase AbiEii/AbiGii toxin family protein [Rhabdobacter roseus]|uniref:Nucleotidyl transferase AbiEii/AbiGii toxin family protein n=1 Tax=Rhabdobacter roseus TaxID=1655419 RepID=A0A840U2Y6_9BACT|nr:nucleotidyl transferase AbiEii/AbiGii toxin family protein [Rhabdobacter roseus]MBB5286708.1 hypothetical protein [Rhabdobacter roseus]